MEIGRVMVAGAGTLGSQIAWQTAFRGFEVVVYDAFEEGLEEGRKLHRRYAGLFVQRLGAAEEEIEAAFGRLRYTTELGEAAGNADLVSESIPENLEIKRDFYRRLGAAAPARAIFTTNTSSLLPSSLADATGRPERFLALHFANGIWEANIAEVMPHPGTDPALVEEVGRFAREIGMVPVFIRKEQPGYILNSLLIPLLGAALGLLVRGVATPEDIDRTWMISARMKMGPCAIMDMVGLETVHHVIRARVEETGDPGLDALAEYLAANYVDRGWLGVKTGRGFYTYPDPVFRSPDFLE